MQVCRDQPKNIALDGISKLAADQCLIPGVVGC
jgi:hypothetical protein